MESDSVIDIDLLQAAANVIEINDIRGLYEASQLVGLPIAVAMMVIHLRRNFGSMQPWATKQGVDDRVADLLAAEVRIVQKFLDQEMASPRNMRFRINRSVSDELLKPDGM